jgi:hypothetical protein
MGSFLVNMNFRASRKSQRDPPATQRTGVFDELAAGDAPIAQRVISFMPNVLPVVAIRTPDGV